MMQQILTPAADHAAHAPQNGDGQGKCPFVQGYLKAHDQAGLERVPLSGYLRKMAAQPELLDRSDAPFCASWLGLDISVMPPENAERISANLLVSFLLQDFQPYLQRQLTRIREQKIDLYSGIARRVWRVPE